MAEQAEQALSQFQEQIQDKVQDAYQQYQNTELFAIWRQWGDITTFVAAILFLQLLRLVQLLVLMALSRTSKAEKFRSSKKPITEKQHQHERIWPVSLIIDTIVLFASYRFLGSFANMSIFNTEGFFWNFLVHATVTETVYYWLHRTLHTVPTLYNRFHSFHHMSTSTEPKTFLSQHLAERLVMSLVFLICPIIVFSLGYQSYITLLAYFLTFDFLSGLAHMNTEALVPSWVHTTILCRLVTTPTYHSSHHTRLRKNFALFMPWTDLFFGTAHIEIRDDLLSLNSAESLPTHIKAGKQMDTVLLVHGAELASVMWSTKFLPASVQSFTKTKNRFEFKSWMYFFYPVFVAVSYLQSIAAHRKGYFEEENFEINAPEKTMCGSTTVVENYGYQYVMESYHPQIRSRIENAILEAAQQGAKVVGLGNFNKAEWLNHGGSDIVEKYGDRLKNTRIVHGDTLTAATIYYTAMQLREKGYWNRSIFITGATSKIGRAVVLKLAQDHIHVYMYTMVPPRFEEIAAEAGENRCYLHYTDKLNPGRKCDLWMTGKMIPRGKELLPYLPKFATVINFSVPDPMNPETLRVRPDILHVDSGLLNFDSKFMSPYFTWLLPPGYIYACLGGSIVHSYLGFTNHEVGAVKIEEMEVYMNGALKLGFRIPQPMSFYQPITLPPPRLAEIVE